MAHKTKIDKLRELQGVPREQPQHAVNNPQAATAPHKQLAHYQQAMASDMAALKALNTVPEKIAAKKTMLASYVDFVDEYTTQGHNYPNDVAVNVMVWCIDCGDIARGLNLGLLLIDQGQKLPTWYTSTMPTFLCDNLYDWANALYKANQAPGAVKQSPSPYLDVLCTHIKNDGWDLNTVVSSKCFALLAKFKFEFGEYQSCLSLCDLAKKYNPERAGVKKLREMALAKIN